MTRKKVDPKVFDGSAVHVARNEILGRYVGRRFEPKKGKKPIVIYGRIIEVSAWEGGAKKMDPEIQRQGPGVLNVSMKYNQRLLDIVTDGRLPYSCITLRAGIFDVTGNPQRVNGPGNLTKALKIDEDFNGIAVNNHSLWIEGDPVRPGIVRKRNLSNLPANCKGVYYFDPRSE
jgi:hypothetical protein